MGIVVVGSVAVDNIKTPAGQARGVLGGSATYFSLAASYFGPVSLISIVGVDFPGKFYRQFKTFKINTEGLLKSKGRTFTWTGSYNLAMDQATTENVAVNVLENFSPKIPESYKRPDFLFLANIDPSVQRCVAEQIEPRYLIGMDTMNLWIETRRRDVFRVMRNMDVMILNDNEARMLTGEPNLPRAAKIIAAWGAKRVIIKKGEHGAFMYTSKKGYFVIPAFIQENLVDTTGAGDSFAGGFFGALQAIVKAKKHAPREADFRKAVVYGNVLASFTVEDFSVKRLVRLTKNDIDRRFRDILKLVNLGC